jgi:predicted carbohydrate-binding protein with CBM5 and CBM33 domain
MVACLQTITPMHYPKTPFHSIKPPCRLKISALLAPSLACLIIGAAGHGSVSDPVSRVYRIFQENPESPQRAVSTAAIATAGTQAFYDWHEISRMVPEYDPASIEPYKAIIPDGQLAGAGREKYAGIDLVRDDWPATSVNPGLYPVVFDAWVPHDPSYFLAFITREGWSPSQPLTWDDLEPLPGADRVVRDDHYYRFNVDFPQRTGHHILYVIWQRIDPAGEVFFSASDIDFGDGTGNGNPGANPDDNPIIPHDVRADVDFSIQSDWSSGFTAEVKITNLADHPINSWELEFEIDQDISSFWNAQLVTREGNHYTVSHSGWNQSIPPGGSVTFGFSATPGTLETLNPSQLTLNGISIHAHDHDHDHDHPSFFLNVDVKRQLAGAATLLTLSFPAAHGNSYIIEKSADMVNWLPQETGIDGTDGMIMRDYPLGDERKIYYRARREHD